MTQHSYVLVTYGDAMYGTMMTLGGAGLQQCDRRSNYRFVTLEIEHHLIIKALFHAEFVILILILIFIMIYFTLMIYSTYDRCSHL